MADEVTTVSVTNVPADLWRRVKERAARRGVPVWCVVVIALTEYLANEPPNLEAE